MLDCGGCNPQSIRSYDNIHSFSKTLVKDIDMIAYGEPQIVNFGTGDKEGFTLVQLIETSNIIAHFCNETNTMYLDTFSCRQFDTAVVIKLVEEYFSPKSIRPTFIVRQA